MTLLGEIALALFAVWLGSMVRDWRLDKFWDEWRGTEDGEAVMFIRQLVQIPIWWSKGKLKSVRIDVHKFVRADVAECFHSHPAYAIRVPLWNSYVEELFERSPLGLRQYDRWYPGRVGLVRPGFAHRVALVQTEPGRRRGSITLWIRGPICSDVKLLGSGWKRERIAAERN